VDTRAEGAEENKVQGAENMVFAAWSINHLSLAALDTSIQRLNPLSCHSARRRMCARCGGCGREEEGKEKEKEKE
jgi:hypothetical protein